MLRTALIAPVLIAPVLISTVLMAIALLGVAATALAATPSDGSRSCLPNTQVKRTRVIDERTILFQVGSRWYRNDLPYACPGLDDTRNLVNHLSTGAQICSGDQFDVLDTAGGIPRAGCAYGKFTPTDKPPAK